MSHEAPELIEATIQSIGPLDRAAVAAATAHLDRLTKPPGSLGRLEEVVVTLAGVTGRVDAPVDRRAIVVVAADHGVARRGVSAYPPEVTGQMVANFVAGGAAINVLAALIGARVQVVDVGVVGEIPGAPPATHGGTPGALVRARIREGTGDLAEGPAMTRDEAERAIVVGLEQVAALTAGGVQLLGIGEMGIGNTTAASVIVAALTGVNAADATGRGTGVDAAGYARKIAAVERALALHRLDRSDPIGVLAAVGGLEIATLVGLILGAAAAHLPLVLDGFITGAAALVACGLAPLAAPRLLAGHRSIEPGHTVALERLRLRPLLDLDLRLGEGTGAALAMGLVVAAAAVRDGMATFASAAVSGPT